MGSSESLATQYENGRKGYAEMAESLGRSRSVAKFGLKFLPFAFSYATRSEIQYLTFIQTGSTDIT